jgi:predicted double-glycine peptidase
MIFSLHDTNDRKLKEGLIKGLQFEKMWYENKSRYYSRIAREDAAYIDTCEKRIANMQDKIAQKV